MRYPEKCFGVQFVKTQTDEPKNIYKWTVRTDSHRINRITLSQVKRFPLEWSLVIEPLPTDDNHCTKILEFLKVFVRKKGGSWLLYICPEDKFGPDQKNFLSTFNFKEHFIDIFSKLDLEGLDLKSFQNWDAPVLLEHWLDIKEKKQSSNQIISTFEEMYNLECLTSDDIPEREGFKHPTFENFLSRFRNKEALEDSIILARKDENIIGLTYAWVESEERAGIFFTGVLTKFRNMGIATALKMKLAQDLKNKGYKTLITNNRAKNLPVLKTNKKMGFKPYYKTFYFRKAV